MAKDTKKPAASKASETMRDPKASKEEKSKAASDLSKAGKKGKGK